MSEAPPEAARKRPRFPYGPAIYCAACVGVAAWMWMRYSYAWDVTPAQLERPAVIQCQVLKDRFVVIRCEPPEEPEPRANGERRLRDYLYQNVFLYSHEGDSNWLVKRKTRAVAPEGFIVRGRLVMRRTEGEIPVYLAINESASRWHGASIFGLAVGVMGVFVFGMYFREWLRERA